VEDSIRVETLKSQLHEVVDKLLFLLALDRGWRGMFFVSGCLGFLSCNVKLAILNKKQWEGNLGPKISAVICGELNASLTPLL
jgi:hypothetical protein